MAGKRKRTGATPKTSQPAQKKKRLATRVIRQSASEDSSKTGFLALPGEAKNQIYSILTHGEAIHVRPTGVDDLTTTHPIAAVCRQTRDEFLSMFTQDAVAAARTVIAQVHDFNIYNIKQFMRLVNEEPGADLRDFDDREDGRDLYVDLTLSEDFCRDPPVEEIAGWIGWMKAIDLPVHFEVRHVADAGKAVEIIEGFCKGYGGDRTVLRQVAAMFREYVTPPPPPLTNLSVRHLQWQLMRNLMR